MRTVTMVTIHCLPTCTSHATPEIAPGLSATTLDTPGHTLEVTHTLSRGTHTLSHGTQYTFSQEYSGVVHTSGMCEATRDMLPGIQPGE